MSKDVQHELMSFELHSHIMHDRYFSTSAFRVCSCFITFDELISLASNGFTCGSAGFGVEVSWVAV